MRLNLKKFVLATIASIILIAGFVLGTFYIKTTYIDMGGTPTTAGVSHPTNIFTGIADLISPTLRGEEEGRINALLLGMGGENHAGGALSDTIILASFNTVEPRIDLFSIPRDLWVNDGSNFRKVNELYSAAGGTAAPDIEKTNAIRKKIEEISGLQMHYAALINFDGIKKIVDMLGGVTLKGQNMNGTHTLAFIRDRSTSGGDFDRMTRQQKLIRAIYDKLLEEDVLRDPENAQELFAALQENFTTDATLSGLLHFSKLTESINQSNIFPHALGASPDGLLQAEFRDIAGQKIYILTPRAGEENYTGIQKFIEQQITP